MNERMVMRKRFAGKGPYLSLEQCQNAIRAERINVMLDAGKRVFGDDGPEVKGTEYELEEAIKPLDNGILCRTKCSKEVTIFGYDASDKRQADIGAGI